MVDLHPIYSGAAELLRIEPTWFGEAGSGLVAAGHRGEIGAYMLDDGAVTKFRLR
jgi:hypothetical protein